MKNATQINLTTALLAQRDSYATKQGDFILADEITILPEGTEWQFMRDLGGRTIRVVYVCQDGTVRDMIGRQGVYASEQDGEVQGIGAPMAQEGTHLSFWTFAHGKKVNTGTGKGYRTLIAANIIAIRCQGVDLLTASGAEDIAWVVKNGAVESNPELDLRKIGCVVESN